MRPRGEVRQALLDAAVQLQAERGACNWRDLAAAAQVGTELAHTTVRNMARAGDLVRVGHEKRAGGGWCALYEPAPPLAGAADDEFAPLAFVLGQWPRENNHQNGD